MLGHVPRSRREAESRAVLVVARLLANVNAAFSVLAELPTCGAFAGSGALRVLAETVGAERGVFAALVDVLAGVSRGIQLVAIGTGANGGAEDVLAGSRLRTERGVRAFVDVLAVLAVGSEDVAVRALAGEAAASVLAAAVAAEIVAVHK